MARILAPVLALALASGLAARSADKIRKDALTAGVCAGNPPFGGSDSSELKGLDYDVVAAVAKTSGFRFRIVRVASLREGEAALSADKVDVVLCSAKPSEELRSRFRLAGPYYRSGLAILVPATDRSTFTLSDLDGRRVAAAVGSEADRLIDSFLPKAKLELVRTFPEGMDLLARGEVDAFIHDRPALQGQARRNPALRLLDVSLTEDDRVIVVGRKSPGLAEVLDAAVDRLRTSADGSPCPLSRICARYDLPFALRTIAAPTPAKEEAPSGSPARRDDLERRIEALERKVRALESRARDSGQRPIETAPNR